MATSVKIKRSLTTATPGSLANGELAFTANGDVLFIGSNGAVVPVAGKRVPGTLTANQALVANSTSGIDKVIVANLVPTSIWANGAAGTAGDILASNGTAIYWKTPLPGVAGSDTQIQFNDGGSLAGDAGLTFNKTSDSVSSNNFYALATVNAATVQVGTSVVANSSRLVIGTAVGLQANGGIGTDGQVLTSNATTVYWSTPTTGTVTSVSTGNGMTGGPITTTGTVSVLANSGIAANSTGVFVKTGSNIFIDGSGNVAVNSTPTFQDVIINGNTTLGDSTSDVVTVSAQITGNLMPSANITYYLGNNTLRWNEVHAQNVHSNSGYFDGNVQISGDLIVSGNVTTTNVNSVVVSDPMLYLAGNNYLSDLVDIGFVANYSPDGIAQLHTGFFRDATDGIWKLFTGSQQELSGNNTVNTTATGYTTASLISYLQSSGLVTNATHVAITANATVNVAIVANTLTLSTALVGTSGGTGKATVANNSLLIGNSTNGYAELVFNSTDGKVLQSNGTTIVYDDIDGGTF